MKCPYCDYKHGWDGVYLKNVVGEEGDFFRLPIKLERGYSTIDEKRQLYACPKCKKTFIDF